MSARFYLRMNLEDMGPRHLPRIRHARPLQRTRCWKNHEDAKTATKGFQIGDFKSRLSDFLILCVFVVLRDRAPRSTSSDRARDEAPRFAAEGLRAERLECVAARGFHVSALQCHPSPL